MKCRADVLLVQKNLASSREKAQALILAGQVCAGETTVKKPGQILDEAVTLKVQEGLPFVSRGGSKLAPALDEFGVVAKNRICLDVGCSTGGFTDCLLQRGASRIYAVDVGYGQFDWKLRNDSRVVLLEKTNFRHLDPSKIPEKVNLAVVDVSFISLTHILPRLGLFFLEKAEALVLIKPQFELSPAEVSKGVVRSEALRQKAIQKIVSCAEKEGFGIGGCRPAFLRGPKGNQEYFLHLLWNGSCATLTPS